LVPVVNKQYLGAGCSDDIIGQLSDLAQANPRFAETRAQIAGFTSRIGGSSALAELVEKELKRGEPKMP
jgi:hypothetical protein